MIQKSREKKNLIKKMPSDFENQLRQARVRMVEDQASRVEELRRVQTERSSQQEEERRRLIEEFRGVYEPLSPIVERLLEELANATWGNGEWGKSSVVKSTDSPPRVFAEWVVGRVSTSSVEHSRSLVSRLTWGLVERERKPEPFKPLTESEFSEAQRGFPTIKPWTTSVTRVISKPIAGEKMGIDEIRALNSEYYGIHLEKGEEGYYFRTPVRPDQKFDKTTDTSEEALREMIMREAEKGFHRQFKLPQEFSWRPID